MARRTIVGLIGLAALGVLAIGCGGGGDVGAERTPPASLTVAEFDVEGMTCGGCALATEIAVRKVDGVASAEADYDEATGEGSCRVEYDPTSVQPDRIARAIREAGFEPTLRERAGG